MLELNASFLLFIARLSGGTEAFGRSIQSARIADGLPHDAGTVDLEPETKRTFVSDMRELERHCESLGLLSCATSARRLVRAHEREEIRQAELQSCFNEFHGRLYDELKRRLCFMVEPSKSEFYTGGPSLFGEAVADRFPEAIVDIEKAGKCFALGRSTACVFHLMRVLELGMQALATDMGIPAEKNWHELLKSLDAKLVFAPGVPVTAAMKEWRRPRAAAVAHLRNVKDAWRNDVMHPRESYSSEQARDILVHCQAFMRSLVAFL